jgi:hypothetical protein
MMLMMMMMTMTMIMQHWWDDTVTWTGLGLNPTLAVRGRRLTVPPKAEFKTESSFLSNASQLPKERCFLEGSQHSPVGPSAKQMKKKLP